MRKEWHVCARWPGHRNLEIFVFYLLHDIDLLQHFLSLNEIVCKVQVFVYTPVHTLSKKTHLKE
jgi:hypothetical protein